MNARSIFMNSLMCRMLIFAMAVAILSTAGSSCSKSGNGNEKGILGIQVPIGEGTVTRNNPYKVVGVYEGSPAYTAGIRPDDIIVQIDGKDIDGMKYQDVYENLLLGKPMTAVTLSILRGEQKETITVIRGRVVSGTQK